MRKNYLLIGGTKDELPYPVQNEEATELQVSVGVTGSERYIRETLSVGGASVTIYRHEELSRTEVVTRFIEYYYCWAVNMPGSKIR